MAYTKETRKEYREKNRERILAYQRKWHAEHPERTREYEKHRDKATRDAWQKKYKEEHKEHLRECFKKSAFKRYMKARMAIIDALGGKCIKCEFNDFRALEVHHKLSDGGKERKIYGVNNYRYYQGLLTHLGDLELLCSNCHAILNWYKKHPDVEQILNEDILVFKK